MKSKWEQCLEIIKCNVKEQEFKTWFQPIEFVTFDTEKKELVLSVPTYFFFEMLDGQFRRLMYKVVWNVYGKANTKSIIYRIQAPQVESPTPKEEEKGEVLDPQLNTDYRFDNFIEGESNKLARSVGQSIAENPTQQTFNPLFIYGSSGVGKTHLVNAIGMRTCELFPEKRVLYVTTHQFTLQFTDSVRNNTRNDFITFYQTIDVLIIDDVQELVGQKATQMAFFHIFNHLKMNGKQIILTSDREPSTMMGMEERLLTRFKWGLMAELKKPNQDLCRKILLNKMRRDGLSIPDDVIDYIAANANESVRDLEGIVNSLMAFSVVYNRDIDLDLAEQIVRRTVRFQNKAVTLENIIEKACEEWGVSQEDVFSKSRKAHIVVVRQLIMYLAQRLTKLTASKIGLHVGGRNHATVLHSITQVKDRMATDKDFAQKVSALERELKRS